MSERGTSSLAAASSSSSLREPKLGACDNLLHGQLSVLLCPQRLMKVLLVNCCLALFNGASANACQAFTSCTWRMHEHSAAHAQLKNQSTGSQLAHMAVSTTQAAAVGRTACICIHHPLWQSAATASCT
jgi:hypothetical protein